MWDVARVEGLVLFLSVNASLHHFTVLRGRGMARRQGIGIVRGAGITDVFLRSADGQLSGPLQGTAGRAGRGSG